MRSSLFFTLLPLLAGFTLAEGAKPPAVEKISLPVSDWIQRADLYFAKTSPEPKGWLLLCPGRNGNGELWVKDKAWFSFAAKHDLWVCGLSFASNRKDDELGRYTLVDQGSGDAVLSQCRQIAGKELPFVVFGFSAGARFTANFQAWKPGLVRAWCAQAVGNWPEQTPLEPSPPGIVASGEYDSGAWFSSLQYFQAGRKLGKPLIWLSLGKTAHKRSAELEEFARDFFDLALSGPTQPAEAEWRDIDSRKLLPPSLVKEDPIFAVWLPTKRLAEKWVSVHHP